VLSEDLRLHPKLPPGDKAESAQPESLRSASKLAIGVLRLKGRRGMRPAQASHGPQSHRPFKIIHRLLPAVFQTGSIAHTHGIRPITIARAYG
jgi:hypothetical protein